MNLVSFKKLSFLCLFSNFSTLVICAKIIQILKFLNQKLSDILQALSVSSYQTIPANGTNRVFKKCQHLLEYQKYLLPGDICGQFHKTFFGIIYTPIGVLP